MSTRSLPILQTAFSQKRLGGSVLGFLALWRSRRALARLDQAALRDVGLTIDEARDEAARALWNVPSHWRR